MAQDFIYFMGRQPLFQQLGEEYARLCPPGASPLKILKLGL